MARNSVYVNHKTYLAMKRKVTSMKLIGSYSFPNGYQMSYQDDDGSYWTHGASDYGHVYVEAPSGTTYYHI